MQYTIRNIPRRLDEAIREEARRQGKSINETTIDALLRAFGLTGEPTKHRDLDDIVGTWDGDEEVEAALRDQRRVDPDLWPDLDSGDDSEDAIDGSSDDSHHVPRSPGTGS